MNHNKTSDSFSNWTYYHCFIYVTIPWMTHWNHPPQLLLLSSGVTKIISTTWLYFNPFLNGTDHYNGHVMTASFIKILNNWSFGQMGRINYGAFWVFPVEVITFILSFCALSPWLSILIFLKKTRNSILKK